MYRYLPIIALAAGLMIVALVAGCIQEPVTSAPAGPVRSMALSGHISDVGLFRSLDSSVGGRVLVPGKRPWQYEAIEVTFPGDVPVAGLPRGRATFDQLSDDDLAAIRGSVEFRGLAAPRDFTILVTEATLTPSPADPVEMLELTRGTGSQESASSTRILRLGGGAGVSQETHKRAWVWIDEGITFGDPAWLAGRPQFAIADARTRLIGRGGQPTGMGPDAVAEALRNVPVIEAECEIVGGRVYLRSVRLFD